MAIRGEVGTAQPKTTEQRDVRDRIETFGILDAHDDRAFAVGFRAIEIGCSVDKRKNIAVTPRKALPAREELQRLALRVRPTEAIGIVEAGDARRLELRRLGIRSEEHTSELQSL